MFGGSEEPFHSQLCAVMRHAERADHTTDWEQIDESWVGSEDFRNWPKDPPLSSKGLEHAAQLAQGLNAYVHENSISFHVVLSSPYYRCVQTAVEICKVLGPGVTLLIDQQLGEVYGPEVMGDDCPYHTHRPLGFLKNYGRSHGVQVRSRMVGHGPDWPEMIDNARQRYITRFLQYIYRSLKVRRNFLVVTHADAVASALSIMPSYNRTVRNVEYGGYFIASREVRKPDLENGVQRSDDFILEEELEPLEISNGYLDEASSPLKAATVGWKTTTSRIETCRKTKETILSKRIFAFREESESNKQFIESLLGDLAAASLGCRWPKSKVNVEDESDGDISDVSIGKSTVLFGDDGYNSAYDSDAGLSDAWTGADTDHSDETACPVHMRDLMPSVVSEFQWSETSIESNNGLVADHADQDWTCSTATVSDGSLEGLSDQHRNTTSRGYVRNGNLGAPKTHKFCKDRPLWQPTLNTIVSPVASSNNVKKLMLSPASSSNDITSPVSSIPASPATPASRTPSFRSRPKSQNSFFMREPDSPKPPSHAFSQRRRSCPGRVFESKPDSDAPDNDASSSSSPKSPCNNLLARRPSKKLAAIMVNTDLSPRARDRLPARRRSTGGM